MKSLSTRIEVRHYGGEAIRHAHDHHQVVVPLQGVMEMDVDGQQDDVTETRAAVIAHGQDHSFLGSDRNSFLVVDVPASTVFGLERQSRLWSAAREQPYIEFDTSLSGFCNFLAGQVSQVEFHGVRSEVAGGLIVEALARGIGLEEQALPEPLRRAVGFISAHCDDPITIAAVAREAGLSESRLYALFKAELRVSPKRYIARQRMQRAALLLEQSRLPIAEIALRVGYGDQSAFTRAFHRETGVSPADHRRTHQAEK